MSNWCKKGPATVRIHDNSSNEARKSDLEKATQKFMKKVMKAQKKAVVASTT